MSHKITEITRRDIFEVFEDAPWWGRLEEVEFLARLYSLDDLPSHDPRHRTAKEDIVRHRYANSDWPDDWVFTDERFDLLRADDEQLLRFLAETLHPAVCSSKADAEALANRLNELLEPDGYRLVPVRGISGRPVFGWVYEEPRTDTGGADAQTHFTEDVRPLVATVARLAELDGSDDERDVLQAARPALDEPEYDNWDGGTYYYTLKLTVPIELFARLGDKTNELEQQIAKRIDRILRSPDKHKLTAVLIQPSIIAGTTQLTDVIAERSASQNPSFWTPGYFRLFLSHVTSFRVRTAAVRQALSAYRISAFVAHETIEPGELWQREIEAALRTMDAMAVLLTPDFHASKWTDQEIGWALGRGVYVLPIRRECDPYGFLGEIQGIQGVGKTVKQVAREVFDRLARHPKTRERIAQSLVAGVEQARNNAEAENLLRLTVDVAFLSRSLISRLEAAISAQGLRPLRSGVLTEQIAGKMPAS